MNDGQDVDSPEYQARVQRMRDKGYNGNGAGVTLAAACSSWKSPSSRDSNRGDYTNDKGDPNQRRLSLTGQAQWATPDTGRRGAESPANLERRKAESGAGIAKLETQAAAWPTPTGARCSSAWSLTRTSPAFRTITMSCTR